MHFTSHYETCAGLEIHFTCWGAQHEKTVIAWHGLARTSRDMDELAGHLSARYRVICPDAPGRGLSQWSSDPKNEYQLSFYARVAAELMDKLHIEKAHWVGTSMGGLIGLGLASLPQSPIARLVLNDVGPTIQFEALVRIGTYLGQPLRWNTQDEASDYLQTISAGFGPHTRAQWLALSRPMLKPDGDRFKLHYDPAIALPFKAITREIAAVGEAMTWAAYDAIRCPTLLLRGAESDLLKHETALAMTERGPKARLVEFEGVGHAPTLVADDQVAAVRAFLLGSDPGP